jgi:hypothetical protein
VKRLCLEYFYLQVITLVLALKTLPLLKYFRKKKMKVSF